MVSDPNSLPVIWSIHHDWTFGVNPHVYRPNLRLSATPLRRIPFEARCISQQLPVLGTVDALHAWIAVDAVSLACACAVSAMVVPSLHPVKLF